MVAAWRMMGLALIVVVASLATTAPADARVQSDFVCWVPDCEFPVDCDSEE